MTRHSPARYVIGFALAVSVAACGGGSTGVGETAAQETAAQEDSSSLDTSDQDGSASPEQEMDTGTDSRVDDADDGLPGGPGDDGGGDGAGDDRDAGGGNPGAPGDILVFEESNVEFGPFRDTGSGHEICEVQGKCTLAAPVKTSGEADPETGLDQCLISTIRYSPPSRPNPDPDGPRDVFPEGATVIVSVTCPEPEVEPEVAPEVQPQVEPEVQPEVVPEVAPEVQPEVEPEVVDPGVEGSGAQSE